MTKPKELKIIGITDFVSFLDAKVMNVPCKIDTGADTSSIHCERIKIKEINGEEYLSFKLLDKKHPLYNGKEILTKTFKERKVKSSFGDYEFRYQVILEVKVMEKTYHTSFNLSNRRNMKYPVLLGRRFLKNRFLVDVAQHKTIEHK